MLPLINECLRVLKAGGVILYPTDTIWGLGCDATNEKAVEKIFAIKKRIHTFPLIVLVSDDRMLNKHVPDAPAASWDIVEQADGPVTIIYEKVIGIAKNVAAADGSCGVRLTRNDFCRDLIHRFHKPIISTSANISGEPFPGNFSEVSREIREAADFIVPLRQLETELAKPSPVVMIKNNGEVKVLR